MNKIKVLIVEDMEEISELLCNFISKFYPYEVVGISSSISDARVSLQYVKPDLIILDNNLPDGTGIEFLMSLRRKSNLVDVLFITATNNINTALTAMRYGAFNYIIKPFSLERINDSLERYYEFYKNIALRDDDQINQYFVNKLYNTHLSVANISEHPKGIDDITLQRILSAFINNIEYTSDGISTETSVSKTTARRYLEYAVVRGFLTANVMLGKVGRPQRIYRRAS